MIALDCGSFESALESSAAILALSPGELLNQLRSFEYGDLPKGQRSLHPYEDLLPLTLFGVNRRDLPQPKTVHWFHATRVKPATTFREGILSLSGVLDEIWAYLGGLASEWVPADVWQHFRENMNSHGGQHYSQKVGMPWGEGPFAFLVREAVFQPTSLRNYDYLGVPEIVEDICRSFDHGFGGALRKSFLATTSPCIVKFRSSRQVSGVLGPALMYIHRSARSEDIWIACNTCCSGRGLPVGAADVLGVEWPRYLEA